MREKDEDEDKRTSERNRTELGRNLGVNRSRREEVLAAQVRGATGDGSGKEG